MSQRQINWLSKRLPSDYEVVEFVGKGGFGLVYKVRNVALERIEALKVIVFDRPELDQPPERLRKDFLREARLMDQLAALTHYIVRVFHVGQLAGDDPAAGYFTMEFVQGRDLERELRENGPLPVPRVLRLMNQVCLALESAHQLQVGDEVGIAHRDLKIKNVMQLGQGLGEEVRILDFGLAKALAETGSTETYNLPRASLGCAPPEQLMAEHVGPQVDLFAAGVMLYELLTGREPWKGRKIPRRLSQREVTELFIRATELWPLPPREFRPDIPEWLEATILRCLRYRPEDRFTSASELKEHLQARRPPKSKTPPETEPVLGSVKLASEPAGVRVVLLRGGHLVDEGRTPRPAKNVPPGHYRAEIRDWRYRKASQDLEVAPGARTDFRLRATSWPWSTRSRQALAGGVLAAAIAAYLLLVNHNSGIARDAAAQSDLVHAATAFQAYRPDNDTLTATLADLSSDQFTASPGVVIVGLGVGPRFALGARADGSPHVYCLQSWGTGEPELADGDSAAAQCLEELKNTLLVRIDQSGLVHINAERIPLDQVNDVVRPIHAANPALHILLDAAPGAPDAITDSLIEELSAAGIPRTRIEVQGSATTAAGSGKPSSASSRSREPLAKDGSKTQPASSRSPSRAAANGTPTSPLKARRNERSGGSESPQPSTTRRAAGGAAVASLRLAPSNTTVVLGDSLRPSVSFIGADGANVSSHQPVTWSSADPRIASVSSEGTVVGHTVGHTTITARGSGDVEGALAVTVAVHAVELRAGLANTCVLTPAGDWYCWGNDAEGQLGNGKTIQVRVTPVRVIANIEKLFPSVMAGYACGTDADGRAYCWGANPSGQLGIGTTGAATLTPTAVAGGIKFATLTLTDSHTCGLTDSGEAYCWGSNRVGELGDGSTRPSSVPVRVTTKLRFSSLVTVPTATCGIAVADGHTYCWGAMVELGAGNPSNLESRSECSRGFCARPVPVQLPRPRLSRLVANLSGFCGLSSSGSAYCWGMNVSKRILRADTAQASKYMGPVLWTPAPVEGNQTFRELTAGFNHVCGLTEGGDAYCWGEWGGRKHVVPVRFAGATREHKMTTLAAGAEFTCGLEETGALYCWGLNNFGQFGVSSKGGSDWRSEPVRVPWVAPR